MQMLFSFNFIIEKRLATRKLKFVSYSLNWIAQMVAVFQSRLMIADNEEGEGKIFYEK